MEEKNSHGGYSHYSLVASAELLKQRRHQEKGDAEKSSRSF